MCKRSKLPGQCHNPGQLTVAHFTTYHRVRVSLVLVKWSKVEDSFLNQSEQCSEDNDLRVRQRKEAWKMEDKYAIMRKWP